MVRLTILTVLRGRNRQRILLHLHFVALHMIGRVYRDLDGQELRLAAHRIASGLQTKACRATNARGVLVLASQILQFESHKHAETGARSKAPLIGRSSTWTDPRHTVATECHRPRTAPEGCFYSLS